ncbi:MAG: ATP-binding cassette domain-containing protein [Alphaproteobacteria bacterium]|nr:ATP-binding cassette domain-containing protein [Alphaproteobacteria bacterium]
MSQSKTTNYLPDKLFPFLWHCGKEPRYIIFFSFLALTSIIISASEIALSYVIKLFVDVIATAHKSAGDLSWETFSPVLFLIGAVLLVNLVFAPLREWFWLLARNPYELRTKERLFDYVQQHSYNFLINREAGNIAQKIYNISWNIVIVLDVIFYGILPLTCIFLFGLAVLFFVHPYIGALAVLWNVLFYAVVFSMGSVNAQLSRDRAAKKNTVAGTIVDAISNHQAVKMFAAQTRELNRLRALVKEEEISQGNMFKFQRLFVLIREVMTSSYFIGAVCLCIYLYLQQQITEGDFALTLTLLSITATKSTSIGSSIREMYEYGGVIKDGIAEICEPLERIETDYPTSLVVKKADITFDHIDFSYQNKTGVFQDFYLHIKAGERVGLIGPSGAGKSSLINLLLGFYVPEKNSILIDGQDMHSVSRQSLIDHISIIPQDTTLFHRSILDNIRYGKVDATDAEVIVAAQKAHAHEFIVQLPQSYDTLVGERGVKLSGGQRQRIAIARAILKNAPILAMDEATSALDSVSERLIQESLEDLMKGKTVIAIAHRLSTISHLERLLVMDNGKIIEDGPHDELLKKGGLYAKLWDMQSCGFIGDSHAAQ